MSNKEKNKLSRAITGNRQNKGIKLAHWNAGSAHLANKMGEIEQLVSTNSPHILGISEANFKRFHDIEDVQLPEYNLILSKTMDNDQLQVSRVVCYMLPGKRKILVCQLYREWRYLGQPDSVAHSHTTQEQMRRWIIFIDQWEQALATGKEVIVLGDCNLDLLKFDNVGAEQPFVDLMLNLSSWGHSVCTRTHTQLARADSNWA